MAVRIRLTRKGKKKQPTYRVVVADQRAPRDGRYIEQIGRYDPRQEPSVVEIDNERALHWIERGAQPSSAVRKLFEIAGVLEARAARPVRTGAVHVVDAAAQAAAEEEAARAAEEAEARAAEAALAAEAEAEVEAEDADAEATGDAGDAAAEAGAEETEEQS